MTIRPDAPDAMRSRAIVRRAYKCDCDGVSHKSNGATGPLASAVKGELDAIESSLGARPFTCPWRAYTDRDVVQIIHAYDLWETGQCREYWGDDPEWWLVDGTRAYHRFIESARADYEKTRAKSLPKPQLPIIGQVVGRITG